MNKLADAAKFVRDYLAFVKLAGIFSAFRAPGLRQVQIAGQGLDAVAPGLADIFRRNPALAENVRRSAIETGQGLRVLPGLVSPGTVRGNLVAGMERLRRMQDAAARQGVGVRALTRLQGM